MARKTKEEAEKTKQRILDEALKVFSKKGFMRTTLNDIATEADVTRGAVYWHFKDKTELFIALAEKIEKTAGLEFNKIIRLSIRSLDDIKTAIMIYMNTFHENKNYCSFYEMVRYKTEWIQGLEPVLIRNRRVMNQIIRVLTKNFKLLKMRNKVRDDLDPNRAAIAVYAFMAGLVEIWFFDKETFSIKDDASGMIDDFLKSMAPSSS